MTLTSQEYVAKQGTHCPNCERTNIETTGHEFDEFGTQYYLECLDCGATWIELHDLVSYSDLETLEPIA
jgi:transposase-like protein